MYKWFSLSALVFMMTISDLAAIGPPPPVNDLHLRAELPDGPSWVLGKGGIGRPFMVRLLLINTAKHSIQIWDHNNSEGARCPGVTLTDSSGKVTLLKPAAIERSAGVPTTLSIAPDRVLAIHVDLLRLIGEHSLPAGQYTLTGSYESRLKNAGTIVKGNVWTGRIESSELKIRILAPAQN